MTAIHNGIKGQWNFLEQIDRFAGFTELIRLDDPRSVSEVQGAARAAGCTEADAWDRLIAGEHLTTAGFVRRLKK